MKRTFFIIAVLSLFITGCSKRETIVTGQITGINHQTLVYTVPVSGTGFLGFNDTLKIDETGTFELKFAITQPVFVTMWIPEPYKQVKLLLEPGNNYHVILDTTNDDIQISGANEKGQMLYVTLPNPGFIEMEGRSLLKDTSLLLIHEKIDKLKQDDLNKFKELLDNKEISPSFFRLVQTDRDCYYASLESRISIIKIYRLIRNENDRYSPENEDDLLKNLTNLEAIYTQYPPEEARLTFSTFWPEYAEYYVKDYKQYIKKDFDVNHYIESMRKKAFIINESKEYLTGKTLEFFQARYLFFESYQSNFEKELIALFGQFKEDYPQSEYSKYLAPLIDKIVLYHQIVAQPFNEAVSFPDNYEDINTLEEAIKPLKGKKIYIDVWATWCGPCKKEFENNDALKKILAEDHIQQLYISIDEDIRDQQWKDGIKFYNLTGNHIRTNKLFYADLMKRYDKKDGTYISIPWYILVDENGTIIAEHAKSPSQLIAGETLIQK
ncbi:MAG: AhpC/TSA family protein [Tannerella sp.]|jgi:thiol-disulfide isomerase/thioredoxin|nr:AhpC/TSA family protein [Tannerella sp.]